MLLTGTASQNQTIAKSCTDSDGHKYHKCYCDRSAGKFPYASCQYGEKPGTSTCVDSSTQREYYHECASPEDACRRDGYEHTNCATETCTAEVENPQTGRTETVSGPCANGDKCPYPANPSMYKCVFNKATYCVGKGYGQTSEVSIADGSDCVTVDGTAGNVQNCPANDGNPTFYYKCKVSCEKKLLSVASRYGLRIETKGLQGQGTFGRFGTATDGSGGANAYWLKLDSVKNGFQPGYHLFLRNDVRIPDDGFAYDTRTSGDLGIRADGDGSLPFYRSINGISALYKLDPTTFSDCADDYDDPSKNPTLTVPLGNYNKNDQLLTRDFNNINLKFSHEDNNGNFKSGWCGKELRIDASTDWQTYTWNNMGIIAPLEGQCSGSTGSMSTSPYTGIRTLIDIHNAKLKFTNKIYFDVSNAVTSSTTSLYPIHSSDDTRNAKMSILTFRCASTYCIMQFNDVDMLGYA